MIEINCHGGRIGRFQWVNSSESGIFYGGHRQPQTTLRPGRCGWDEAWPDFHAWPVIKSVLAHPSQMVEITYEGRVYRIPPGGKVIICNVGDATNFRALCAKVIAYNEGQSPYNFSQLNSHERDNAAYDAWVQLKDEIKSALAATANDRLIPTKLAV